MAIWINGTAAETVPASEVASCLLGPDDDSFDVCHLDDYGFWLEDGFDDGRKLVVLARTESVEAQSSDFTAIGVVTVDKFAHHFEKGPTKPSSGIDVGFKQWRAAGIDEVQQKVGVVKQPVGQTRRYVDTPG
jgi:hypothetical protein